MLARQVPRLPLGKPYLGIDRYIELRRGSRSRDEGRVGLVLMLGLASRVRFTISV